MLLLMVAYSNSEMTWLRTKKPIKKKKKKNFFWTALNYWFFFILIILYFSICVENKFVSMLQTFFPKELSDMIFETVHVFPEDFFFLINTTIIFANFKRCLLATRIF